jgi:hypothetical protein
VRWPELFMATGFCSSKDWVFLGLSMANWSALVLPRFLVAAAGVHLPVISSGRRARHSSCPLAGQRSGLREAVMTVIAGRRQPA